MTKEDAEKICEFSGEYDNRKGRLENPVLVLGDIPNVEDISDCTDGMVLKAYDGMNKTCVCPFNYTNIDSDYFAAYPAAHKGKFYLMGDDCDYINSEDLDLVYQAYIKAKQARFEHGESG